MNDRFLQAFRTPCPPAGGSGFWSAARLDHVPDVPPPAPPMPPVPPEVPTELPPATDPPGVPHEQPPIKEPPPLPGKIIALQA